MSSFFCSPYEPTLWTHEANLNLSKERCAMRPMWDMCWLQRQNLWCCCSAADGLGESGIHTILKTAKMKHAHYVNISHFPTCWMLWMLGGWHLFRTKAKMMVNELLKKRSLHLDKKVKKSMIPKDWMSSLAVSRIWRFQSLFSWMFHKILCGSFQVLGTTGAPTPWGAEKGWRMVETPRTRVFPEPRSLHDVAKLLCRYKMTWDL